MIQFLLCITIFPFLAGAWLLKRKIKKSINQEVSGEEKDLCLIKIYITGVLLLFLLAEVASCIIIKADGSFSEYSRLLGILILFCCFPALLFCRKELLQMGKKAWNILQETAALFKAGFGGKKAGSRERKHACLLGLVVFLFFVQTAGLFLYVPAVGADTTVETVYATLLTDTVFRYNPVTGSALQFGMYPVYKLASLPLLYSACINFCRLDVRLFLHILIPVWILLLNYLLTAGLSRLFFKGQKEKQYIFLLFYGLLNVMGDYHETTYAYLLLHEGWKGSAVSSAVIVPFALYLLYEAALCGNTVKTRVEKLVSAAVLTGLCFTGWLFARPLFGPSYIFASVREGNQWGLFLVSFLALILIREKNRKKWKKEEFIFFGVSLASCVLAANPLPVLCTAYAGAEIARAGEEKQKGMPVLTGLLVLICLTGTILPYRAEIVKKEYVPDSERKIQEQIAGLAAGYGENARLAAPNAVMEEARLLNGKLTLPYGKDLWRENCNREIADVYTEEQMYLYELMQTDYLQPDAAAGAALLADCNILAMREAMSREAERQYGWQRAEGAAGYALYYR